MDIFSGLELREIPLNLDFAKRRRDALLAECGLRAEDADFAVGVYDCDDRLLATASLAGDIIKCIATDESVRGESLAPAMVTAIMSHAAEKGVNALRVFTKPEYEPVFSSLSFSTVGSTDKCVLMEQKISNLHRYTAYLRSLRREGRTGCVVVNANPMTLGHLHLITIASREVDTLFVIPVADDTPDGFSYKDRTDILRSATSNLKNVQVIEGSAYAVSRSTFPSYFIKEESDISAAHVALDLDIFTRHIAPSLGVTVRFVGSEPNDPLTASYNAGIHRILPSHGIEVREIPRIGADGNEASPQDVISASKVRKLLREGRAGEAFGLVAPPALPYLLGRTASYALRRELELTPKPGLVDRDNNGAHTDMDHALMSLSIDALTPVFTLLAALAGGGEMPTPSLVKAVGMQGEMQMMATTGGVNTHRGALFSIGLAVTATSRLIAKKQRISTDAIMEIVSDLAKGFPRPGNTHGAEVTKRYGIPGALDAARSGYPEAVAVASISDPYRMLLKLMSTVEDSNIYHRCGAETAAEVKMLAQNALALPDESLPTALKKMDADFISRRISPGGAADMLALAFFLQSVTSGDAADAIGEEESL